MRAVADDLIHLGQVLAFEEIYDFHERLLNGRLLNDFEIEAITARMGLETALLRRLNDPKVRRHGGKERLPDTAAAVTNARKARRITSTARYVDLVTRIGEAQVSSAERRERAQFRKEMVEHIRALRPRGRSSRVRGAVRESELAKVATFIVSGDAEEIWTDPSIQERNWAIVSLLVLAGLRSSELRQIRTDEVDTNECTLIVSRRPDDPQDPRTNEPNAKTADRIIPLSHDLAERLDRYLLGSGQQAALISGSPFVFLSSGNSSYGEPISQSVINNAVRQLGVHLGVPHLHPHALRSAWLQNLAAWANAKGIGPSELDRFANYLGGWSYLSKISSHYRGDHLTRKAFEAGLIVEEER